MQLGTTGLNKASHEVRGVRGIYHPYCYKETKENGENIQKESLGTTRFKPNCKADPLCAILLSSQGNPLSQKISKDVTFSFSPFLFHLNYHPEDFKGGTLSSLIDWSPSLTKGSIDCIKRKKYQPHSPVGLCETNFVLM